jgi:hypothetical protein
MFIPFKSSVFQPGFPSEKISLKNNILTFTFLPAFSPTVYIGGFLTGIALLFTLNPYERK